MPLSIAQAFGSALRNIRRKADLTQEQVADYSRLSRVTLWKIENAASVANLETVYRISKGLGISMTELMAVVESQLSELKPTEPKVIKSKTDSPGKSRIETMAKRSPKKRK